MTEVVIPKVRVADGFRRSVADYFRQTADQGIRLSGGVTAKTAARTLRVAAEYTDALKDDDQRLVALYETQVYGVRPAGSEPASYVPGRDQATILANVAATAARPSAEELLAELIAAAIRDLVKATNLRSELHAERAERDARSRARATFEPATLEAQDEAVAANQRAAEAEGRYAELAKERDYLVARLDAIEEAKAQAEQPEPKPKAQPKRKRREAVEGYTGVYSTATGLEIGWMEDGKQRWETLGEVSLDEAVAAREAKLKAGAPA